MANKRIDQLNPNLEALTGNEFIPIFDTSTNTTERITLTTLSNFFDQTSDTYTIGGTFILSASTIEFSTNNGANYSVDVSELDSKYGVLAVTYSELQTLHSNSDMSAGTTYHITDRDIWLTALSSSELSIEGVKSQMCPTEYFDNPLDGNQWQGVYPGIKVVGGTGDLELDDLCIWGGRVWKKITNDNSNGSAESASELDSTNWELVDSATFTNNEYTKLFFGINYDFINDTVTAQWDGKDNYFYTAGHYGMNNCDWNNPNIINNRCYGVMNNTYANNNVVIRNNNLPGGIVNNTNLTIMGNKLRGNNGQDCHIQNNTSVPGSVTSEISFNTCKSNISNNTLVQLIRDNSNNGSIFNCRGTILNNSNNGVISYATYAINNSNNGVLTNLNNTLSGIYINNTDKSLSLRTENLGGLFGNIYKFVGDQPYFNNNSLDPLFVTVYGETAVVQIDSGSFTGALNLELSSAWNTSKQGIKFIQILADGPITVNQMIGLPYSTSLRFINVGASITFTTNVSGNYLPGGIYNKLDSLGNPVDITLLELGDWVEYEYTAYPNIKPGIASSTQIPNDIKILETAYGIHREMNHGLYPPIDFEFPLTLMYKSGVRNGDTDTLAWIVIGLITSDPPTIATISWTDSLGNPQIYDIVASDPPTFLMSGTFSRSGDDIAIDNQYTLYMETAGVQSFTHVFTV